MNCPLCNNDMKVEKYEGVEIDSCSSCKGVWLDNDELVKVVDKEDVEFNIDQIKESIEEISQDKTKRKDLLDHILSLKNNVNIESLKPEEIVAAFRKKWGGTREIPCPKCNGKLKEFEYASTGIMIDKCPNNHGFWLDDGELDKVQIMMEYFAKAFSPIKKSKQTKTGIEKICPQCKVGMSEKEYEGVPIDICFKCGGVWLDKGELTQILKIQEQTFTEEQKASVKLGKKYSHKSTDFVGEISCPVCGILTKRFAYGATSGIIIDRCPGCDGVWLDMDELEKIQIHAEKIDEQYKKDFDRMAKIAKQARDDFQKNYEASVKEIKVSRFEVINKLMRWLAA